jgi:hypothetical protein
MRDLVGDPEHFIQLTHPPITFVPQDGFPNLAHLVPYHPEMASALPSAAAFEQTVGPGALPWFQKHNKVEHMLHDPFYLDFSSISAQIEHGF